MPQSMIDKFSKRTDEIEDEAERLGITDAARKAELGAKTRSKKHKELTPARAARGMGWLNLPTTNARRWRRSMAGKSTAATAVTAGAGGGLRHRPSVSEKLSVVPERELKRVALLHGLGGVTPEQVAAELPRQGVITEEIDGRLMATTEELQEEEHTSSAVAARAAAASARSACPRGLPARWRTANRSMTASGRRCTGLLGFEQPRQPGRRPGRGGQVVAARQVRRRHAAGRAVPVTYLATTSDAAGVLARGRLRGQYRRPLPAR